jgi:hypothetical protein
MVNELTVDQLEGLWSELYGGNVDWVQGVGFAEVPCVMPEVGPDDADFSTGKLHDILEQVLLVEPHEALLTNLRSTEVGGNCPVMNHAIYRFESELEEAEPESFPGDPLMEPNEKVITVKTKIWANRDLITPPIPGKSQPLNTNDCPDPDPMNPNPYWECDCPSPDFGDCLAYPYSRELKYEYRIEYEDTGDIETEAITFNDFIEVLMRVGEGSDDWEEGAAPKFFGRLDETYPCVIDPCDEPADRNNPNPKIGQAKLEQLDRNNP